MIPTTHRVSYAPPDDHLRPGSEPNGYRLRDASGTFGSFVADPGSLDPPRESAPPSSMSNVVMQCPAS